MQEWKALDRPSMIERRLHTPYARPQILLKTELWRPANEMAAHKKHDWPTIAADYIEGWQNGERARHMPTLEEVASKWKMNLSLVYGRAAADKWTTKREEFQRNLQAERSRFQVRELAKDQRRFTIKVAELDSRLLVKIEKTMDAMGDTAPPKQLKEVGDALRVAQVIGMTALGIDPDYPQKSLEEVMDEPEGSPMKRLGRTLYVEIVPKPPPEAHSEEGEE